MNSLFSFMVLASSWISQLSAVRSSVVAGKLGGIALIGVAIAAFFCGVSLLTVSRKYIEGREFSAKDIYYPIIILVICMNFSLMLNLFHYVVNKFEQSLEGSVEPSKEQFDERFNEITLNLANSMGIDTSVMTPSDKYVDDPTLMAIKFEKGEDSNRLHDLWNGTVDFFARAATTLSNMRTIRNGIAKGIVEKGPLSVMKDFGRLGVVFLFNCIMKLARDVIYVYLLISCYFHLTFLSLIGPLVFAFSILNNFQRGLINWIETYIQTALWPAVTNIVMYINNAIFLNVVSPQGQVGLVSLVLMLVAVVSLFKVPQLSSKIIESTGFGAEAQGVFSGMGRAVGGFVAGKVF